METLHYAIQNNNLGKIKKFLISITDATDIEKTREHFRETDTIYKSQYRKSLLKSAFDIGNKEAVQLFYLFGNSIKKSESTGHDDIELYIEPLDKPTSPAQERRGENYLAKQFSAITSNPNETLHLTATHPDGGSYILEQFLGVHINPDLTKPSWKVMKANDISQILNRKLKYNKDDKKLYRFTNLTEVASTIGKTSKSLVNTQAFILSQNGSLYIDSHTDIISSGAHHLNHGTLSGGLPVITAGLITIVDGKITLLSNNSGHYQPDKLDMYRAITKMQKEMPEVFAPECIIDIYGLNPERLTAFLANMNKADKDSKPYHQILHDKRLKKRVLYKQLIPLIEPLKGAIQNGYLKKAARLLSKFTDISAADKAYIDQYNKPLLLHAIECGRENIVELLLEQRAYINTEYTGGIPALCYVISTKQKGIIALLLEKGANLDATDRSGKTAMHYAVIQNQSDTVKMLLEKGANLDATDRSGKTALHYAIIENHSSIVRRILEKGVNLEATDNSGKTALHYAIIENQSDTVKMLLEKGVNLKATDKDGKTYLQYAISPNQTFHSTRSKITEILLKKGADAELTDKKGKTYLHHAIDKGEKKLVEIILEKGVNLEATDKDGKTYLQYAINQNQPEIVKMMLEKGADIKATDKDGKTCLHYAISQNQPSIVKIMLEKKINLEATDKLGRTYLLYATTQNQQEQKIVEILLKKGANIKATNKHGETAPNLRPQFFTTRTILKIFKEAIDERDKEAITHLDKNFPQFKDKLMEGQLHQTLLTYASKESPEVAAHMIDLSFKPNPIISSALHAVLSKIYTKEQRKDYIATQIGGKTLTSWRAREKDKREEEATVNNIISI